MPIRDDDGGAPNPGSNGGPGVLDPDLRERVGDAMTEFERCFAAATAQPNRHNLEKLRAATDALVRAGARVLIELNRS